jgi:hypothetical protein
MAHIQSEVRVSLRRWASFPSIVSLSKRWVHDSVRPLGSRPQGAKLLFDGDDEEIQWAPNGPTTTPRNCWWACPNLLDF